MIKEFKKNVKCSFSSNIVLGGKLQKLRGIYYLTSKKCVIPMDIFKEKKKNEPINFSVSQNFESNMSLSQKREP